MRKKTRAASKLPIEPIMIIELFGIFFFLISITQARGEIIKQNKEKDWVKNYLFSSIKPSIDILLPPLRVYEVEQDNLAFLSSW